MDHRGYNMDYKEYIDKLQAEVDILKRISKFIQKKTRMPFSEQRLMNLIR